MSEAATIDWAPRSAWNGYARAGRYGRLDGTAGLRFALCDRLGLSTIIAADGRTEALRARLSDRFGADLPEPGTARISAGRGLIWSALGQWLAIAETPEDLRDLPDLLRGVAAVSDQSDGRAVLRISGAQARTTLEKGVAIDLHPRAFGAGRTAVTSIAHIGVQLWQVDNAPTYEIAVARSFAGSFWSWLTEAAAEFGYDVSHAPPR